MGDRGAVAMCARSPCADAHKEQARGALASPRSGLRRDARQKTPPSTWRGVMNVSFRIGAGAFRVFSLVAGLLLAASTGGASDLNVNATAKYFGAFGMQVQVSGAAPAYVEDDSPGVERRYRARFYVNAGALSLASGDELELFSAYAASGTRQLSVLLGRSGTREPAPPRHTARRRRVRGDRPRQRDRVASRVAHGGDRLACGHLAVLQRRRAGRLARRPEPQRSLRHRQRPGPGRLRTLGRGGGSGRDHHRVLPARRVRLAAGHLHRRPLRVPRRAPRASALALRPLPLQRRRDVGLRRRRLLPELRRHPRADGRVPAARAGRQRVHARRLHDARPSATCR